MTPYNENFSTIDSIYVVVSELPDGSQGLCAVGSGFNQMPLFTSHKETIDMAMPALRKQAEEDGMALFVIRFSNTEIIEKIGGYHD